MEQLQDEWLMDDKNWKKWSLERFTASEVRVLLSLWYGDAFNQTITCLNLLNSSWKKTGLGMGVTEDTTEFTPSGWTSETPYSFHGILYII